jgi:hypothetical protein
MIIFGRSVRARVADVVHVDATRFAADRVVHWAEPLTGRRDRRAMGQVPAMRQFQGQERVAGVHEREVDGEVRGRARVRLDVGVLGAEQSHSAGLGQFLNGIDELLALVVTLAGVTLGVLVVQHRAARFEHRRRDIVLGRDHPQLVVLALRLVLDELGQVRVDRGEVGQLGYVHGRLLSIVVGTQALRCRVHPGRLARRACVFVAPRWLLPPQRQSRVRLTLPPRTPAQALPAVGRQSGTRRYAPSLADVAIDA